MPTRWAVRASLPTEQNAVEKFQISPITLNILAARGIRGAEQIKSYLQPTLKDLADPFLLTGMRAARERILKAVDECELIMIHGDYDVDGVTASAIMSGVLNHLSANFISFVPHRKSGYGFNKEGVEFAKQNGAML